MRHRNLSAPGAGDVLMGSVIKGARTERPRAERGGKNADGIPGRNERLLPFAVCRRGHGRPGGRREGRESAPPGQGRSFPFHRLGGSLRAGEKISGARKQRNVPLPFFDSPRTRKTRRGGDGRKSRKICRANGAKKDQSGSKGSNLPRRQPYGKGLFVSRACPRFRADI